MDLALRVVQLAKSYVAPDGSALRVLDVPDFHVGPGEQIALKFGRDLDSQLADRFVGMYVNHWTLDYGETGRTAITRLLAEGASRGLVPAVGEIEYL